jgi:peptidoglycan/LPS O-acetylase OafA/YrhL
VRVTTKPDRHLSESLNRVESIDALRGFAALMVVIYHARGMFWVGCSETYHRYGFHPDFSALIGYISVPLSYGSLGVTLFFVLSGYCIHRQGARKLAENRGTAFNFRAFAVRRFWRIYPTYVAALLVTALVDAWIAARTGAWDPHQDDSPYAFVMSLLTMQGYLAYYFGSNAVFWTLAMEVHLYLAYPLLFALTRRFGPRITVLFTLAVAMLYLAADACFHIEQHLTYRFERGPIFLPYWFTWAAGFYIAEMEAGRVPDFSHWIWRGLMATGLLIGLVLTNIGANEAADIFWALFFAGLLRWSLQPSGRRFWAGRFGLGMAFIGVFSYSLYAIHAPVLHLIHSFAVGPDDRKLMTIWPALGATLLAIVVAWIFFQLVERWSLRPRSVVSSMKGVPKHA